MANKFTNMTKGKKALMVALIVVMALGMVAALYYGIANLDQIQF